jgi:hypothetical protein
MPWKCKKQEDDEQTRPEIFVLTTHFYSPINKPLFQANKSQHVFYHIFASHANLNGFL